jgi:hypothetical protein
VISPLHLKSHVDKNLRKPLIAGWSNNDIASNLKLWLDTLNATNNSSPDKQKYRQKLKDMEQDLMSGKAHRGRALRPEKDTEYMELFLRGIHEKLFCAIKHNDLLENGT